MDIDFQTHTPLSILPSAECLSGGAEHTQAPGPLRLRPREVCPTPPSAPARMVDSGTAFLRERSPAFPHGPVSFQPGAVPAPSLTCISAPRHLPPPQVSLSTLPRITNPRGSRQKAWIPGVKSVPHLFCLKKREGVAVRQPDGKFPQPAYGQQGRSTHRRAKDLVLSSLSKLDNAHYSTRRAPARTAQKKDTLDLHMHRKHEQR